MIPAPDPINDNLKLAIRNSEEPGDLIPGATSWLWYNANLSAPAYFDDLVVYAVLPEDEDSHANLVMPEDIKILPEQMDSDSVTSVIIAAYNNTRPIFNITGTERKDNDLIIRVNSFVSEQGKANITARTAYTTFSNLSLGNYTIWVLDNSTGIEIAREKCTIRQMGKFMDKGGITGIIGTFKGGALNGTLYLMPFPTVPVCPPGLSSKTIFWANSTDKFYLAINFTNEAGDKKKTELRLSSPEADGITIIPQNVTIGHLNNSSSALCIFQVETRELAYAIYNITYNISYLDGVNKTLTFANGTLPMGIYERHESCSEDFSGNIITNTSLITPFGDAFNYTATGWYNISTPSGRIWLPSNTHLEANLSNYTLQEPRSPMPLFLVGAVAGGAICGGATALEQWLDKKPIDWNEVCTNAAKGAFGGAVMGLTCGFAGTVKGANLGMTQGEVLKSLAKEAAIGLIPDASDQMVTESKIKFSNIVTNALFEGYFSSALYGIAHIGSTITPTFIHVKLGGGVGKWAKVSKLWHEGRYIDAALYYNSKATHLAHSYDIEYEIATELIRNAKDLYDFLNGPTFRYIADHRYRDPTGEKLVEINGQGRVLDSLDSSTDYSTTYSLPRFEVMKCEVNGIWKSVFNNTHVTGQGSEEIRWGDDERKERSGLRFDSYKQIRINLSENFCLGRLTHFNWVTSGTETNEATLSVALHFVDPIVSPDPQFNFELIINDTNNRETKGACDKSIQKSDTPCDDLIEWKILNPYQNFRLGNEIYTLDLSGFVDEYPSGNAVNRFVTEENKTSTAYIVGRIIPHNQGSDNQGSWNKGCNDTGGNPYPPGTYLIGGDKWTCDQGNWNKGCNDTGDNPYPPGTYLIGGDKWTCDQGNWNKGCNDTGDNPYPPGTHLIGGDKWTCDQGKWTKTGKS